MNEVFLGATFIGVEYDNQQKIRRLPYELDFGQGDSCTVYTDPLFIAKRNANKIAVIHINSHTILPTIERNRDILMGPLDLYFVTASGTRERNISIRHDGVEILRAPASISNCNFIDENMTTIVAVDNQTTTVSGTAINEKLELGFDSASDGIFKFEWYFEWSANYTSIGSSEFVITLDNSIRLGETTPLVLVQANDFTQSICGTDYRNLPSGQHTVRLLYRNSPGTDILSTLSIKRARLSATRLKAVKRDI